jgi:hypothetical protein
LQLPRAFREAGFADVEATPDVTDDLPAEVLFGGVNAETRRREGRSS